MDSGNAKVKKTDSVLDFMGISKPQVAVPWTARQSNQSILKEINPEYSLERLILKLKLQYFAYLV